MKPITYEVKILPEWTMLAIFLSALAILALGLDPIAAQLFSMPVVIDLR